MKKLIIAMLMLAGSSAMAQSGGLTLDNCNNRCGVWVKMFGWDAFNGYPMCSLESSVNIYVPPAGPGCLVTWNSVFDFQGPISGSAPPVGWASGVFIPLASTTFQWTDVSYQYECPPGVLCDAGGNLTNSIPCLVPPAPSTCLTPFPSPCIPAAWTPVCLPPMGNLTITF